MSQRRASLAGLGGGIRRPGGSQGDPPVEVQKDGSVGGKGTASDAEAAKAARRRQSLSMMSAGSMGGGMNAAMKDHICKQSGITDDTPPQEKMDIVLKLAKEKGKTAEQRSGAEQQRITSSAKELYLVSFRDCEAKGEHGHGKKTIFLCFFHWSFFHFSFMYCISLLHSALLLLLLLCHLH